MFGDWHGGGHLLPSGYVYSGFPSLLLGNDGGWGTELPRYARNDHARAFSRQRAAVSTMELRPSHLLIISLRSTRQWKWMPDVRSGMTKRELDNDRGVDPSRNRSRTSDSLRAAPQRHVMPPRTRCDQRRSKHRRYAETLRWPFARIEPVYKPSANPGPEVSR